MTVWYRFGSWSLFRLWAQGLVKILRLKFRQDFEAGFCSVQLLWQDELNPRVRCAFGNVCIIYTHSQHICWVIVPFLCKRLNQTFHMSTLDIFPMQKRCQMNNLWSLFAMKYSFLSLPAFPKGRIVYRCSLEKPLFTKADVCIPVSSICVYIGDEKIPLGWEYADLLNQTDWWNWSWTIKLEFSNLIDYLSCTSTIHY